MSQENIHYLIQAMFIVAILYIIHKRWQIMQRPLEKFGWKIKIITSNYELYEWLNDEGTAYFLTFYCDGGVQIDNFNCAKSKYFSPEELRCIAKKATNLHKDFIFNKMIGAIR